MPWSDLWGDNYLKFQQEILLWVEGAGPLWEDWQLQQKGGNQDPQRQRESKNQTHQGQEPCFVLISGYVLCRVRELVVETVLVVGHCGDSI